RVGMSRTSTTERRLGRPISIGSSSDGERVLTTFLRTPKGVVVGWYCQATQSRMRPLQSVAPLSESPFQSVSAVEGKDARGWGLQAGRGGRGNRAILEKSGENPRREETATRAKYETARARPSF